MRVSRRDLIKTGSLAGAAAFVPLAGLLGDMAEAAVRPSQNAAVAVLNRPTFESHVGDYFDVKAGGTTVRLRLASVGDTPTAALAQTTGAPDCFTLLFEGPLTGVFGQDTYSVNNRSLGPFALFLVPGGRTSRAARYVATFNRVTA
jgi:hypothetical protein